MSLRLVKTCHACPEQYDVYDGAIEIGYLRLRHGYFLAQYKGVLVYSSAVKGDGSFDNDDERKRHLDKAVRAILPEHRKGSPLYTIEDESFS